MDQNRAHQLDEVIQFNLLKNSKAAIRKAQWMLFGVAILGYLFTTYMYYFYYMPVWAISIGVGASSIYLVLALLSFKKPKTPIIIGMVTYGYVIFHVTLLDPTTLFDGIIIKLIVLIGLIKGFFAAKEAEVLEYKLEIIRAKLRDNKEL